MAEYAKELARDPVLERRASRHYALSQGKDPDELRRRDAERREAVRASLREEAR